MLNCCETSARESVGCLSHELLVLHRTLRDRTTAYISAAILLFVFLYGFAVKEEPPGHSRFESDPPSRSLSHVSSRIGAACIEVMAICSPGGRQRSGCSIHF